MKSRSTWLYLLPAITILAAFFVLPVVRLIPASVSSESGLGLYLEIITNPRYSTSVLSTIVLSVFVTLASLFVGGLSGLFLERHRFWGRDAVVGLITLPLSFPGIATGTTTLRNVVQAEAPSVAEASSYCESGSTRSTAVTERTMKGRQNMT